MMRTIVAILAFSPALLHAQTNSPAQPRSTPVLQSTLIQPVAYSALASSPRSGAAEPPVRVSTGVTPAVLIHAEEYRPIFPSLVTGSRTRTVVVDMTVDSSGKPMDLKVAKSSDPLTDENVLETVSHFRYRPAMLNGQPTPIPITLRYIIKSNE